MPGPFDRFDASGGNAKSQPWYQSLASIPKQLINQTFEQMAQAMRFRFGGLLTYEKPIVEFYGDYLVGINASVQLMAGTDLPRNCVNVRFIALIPGVSVSVNGYPFRTVLDRDAFVGVEIHSLQIVTDGTGTCIVQATGTGD